MSDYEGSTSDEWLSNSEIFEWTKSNDSCEKCGLLLSSPISHFVTLLPSDILTYVSVQVRSAAAAMNRLDFVIFFVVIFCRRPFTASVFFLCQCCCVLALKQSSSNSTICWSCAAAIGGGWCISCVIPPFLWSLRACVRACEHHQRGLLLFFQFFVFILARLSHHHT